MKMSSTEIESLKANSVVDVNAKKRCHEEDKEGPLAKRQRLQDNMNESDVLSLDGVWSRHANGAIEHSMAFVPRKESVKDRLSSMGRAVDYVDLSVYVSSSIPSIDRLTEEEIAHADENQLQAALSRRMQHRPPSPPMNCIWQAFREAREQSFWICSSCTSQNRDMDNLTCEICHNPRAGEPQDHAEAVVLMAPAFGLIEQEPGIVFQAPDDEDSPQNHPGEVAALDVSPSGIAFGAPDDGMDAMEKEEPNQGHQYHPQRRRYVHGGHEGTVRRSERLAKRCKM